MIFTELEILRKLSPCFCLISCPLNWFIFLCEGLDVLVARVTGDSDIVLVIRDGPGNLVGCDMILNNSFC